MSGIKTAKSNRSKDNRAAIHNIIAGNIANKYNAIKYLSQKTGLDRNKLGTVNCKEHQI